MNILKPKFVVSILIILFCLHSFFHFYELKERADFGWDQVDSAWAAKSIIVDKKILLQGPVAKGNSGIYMGPLYYYFITPFYAASNLNPIASAAFAGAVSTLGFLVIYYVSKNLFNINTAIAAAFIYTFSAAFINDRNQSAYDLMPIISILILYFLYKTATNNPKYLLPLAASLGFAFHVDFTSIFYPAIILLAIPVIPKNKATLKFLFPAVVIFLILTSPIIYNMLIVSSSATGNFIKYAETYYHGLHLRRVLQLSHDAFISFESVLQFRILRSFVFIVPFIFAGIYYLNNRRRDSLILFYLIALWIIVPWLILSTYRGELTDYYFSPSLFPAVMIVAYITISIFNYKKYILSTVLIIFWVYYAYYGVSQFIKRPHGNLSNLENNVKQSIAVGEKIPFIDKKAEPYLYYIYTRKNNK